MSWKHTTSNENGLFSGETKMTEDTHTTLHDLILRTFATLEAKDLDAMMSLFADDAVVIDPHFPTPTLRGKTAIWILEKR